jgi:hypothetical protein
VRARISQPSIRFNILRTTSSCHSSSSESFSGLDRRWLQCRLRTLLIVVTAIQALVWACDRSGGIIADGRLDVEMRYQDVDAKSGRVVSDATVEFKDEIVELNLGVSPEAAVSGVVCLQTESGTFLTFNRCGRPIA